MNAVIDPLAPPHPTGVSLSLSFVGWGGALFCEVSCQEARGGWAGEGCRSSFHLLRSGARELKRLLFFFFSILAPQPFLRLLNASCLRCSGPAPSPFVHWTLRVELDRNRGASFTGLFVPPCSVSRGIYILLCTLLPAPARAPTCG